MRVQTLHPRLKVADASSCKRSMRSKLLDNIDVFLLKIKNNSPDSLISLPTSWVSINQQFLKERKKKHKQLILIDFRRWH